MWRDFLLRKKTIDLICFERASLERRKGHGKIKEIDAQKYYQIETDKMLGEDSLEMPNKSWVAFAFSEGTEQNSKHRDDMFRI